MIVSSIILAACISPIHEDKGTVTSTYGWRILYGRTEKTVHVGVDIAADPGTKVRSIFSGKVIFAKLDAHGGGLMIDVLSHRNGQKSVMRYAHLSKITVREGDIVKPNQVIGLVGSTGNSTGPHLHIEYLVKRPGRSDLYKNPSKFLCKYDKNILLPHFKIEKRFHIEN
jgi:murein DD-endopeptidase MepM/ murein hydrolase activator NlpD